ncbi:glycosyltransferase family 2 protein [Paracoccaceae bacterium]|nr:glycosyltransferase family 2 protein [Paracoccaceae bacterium]
MTSKTLISICIPVLNEEKNISAAYLRIKDTFRKLKEYDFEIIFTDNASTDGTYNIIEKIASNDTRVRLASFSRNQGYQKSILTGFLLAKGACAVQLDCDLQDPPELIVTFLEKWRMGFDVVYGVRRKRAEFKMITTMRQLYYRFLNSISEDHLPPDAGDFRLIDRRIIEVLRQIDEQSPYLRGTIARLGFKQTGIEYDRAPRVAGTTKFKIGQLLSLSIDGVVSNSIIPLRFAAYLALITGSIAFFLVIRYLWKWSIVGESWPSGFVTLTILILVNIAATSTLFAIFGAYMIRLSSQTKSMPVSIIARGIKIGKIAQPAKAIIIDASQNKPDKRFSAEQVHSGETATTNSNKNIEEINDKH